MKQATMARGKSQLDGQGEIGQLQQIGEIEKRLWSSADTLRANSNFASNEYFLPMMVLIFLRHAYSRFLRVKGEIEEKLSTRGGKKRDPSGDPRDRAADHHTISAAC